MKNKRGRPKNSGKKAQKAQKSQKLKVSKKKIKKIYKSYSSYKREEIVYPEVKSYKFIGYCECGSIISEKDIVSKLKCICPICDNKMAIKRLNKEKRSNSGNNDVIDKKEYTNEKRAHVDTIPLNDHEINPNEFKVQE